MAEEDFRGAEAYGEFGTPSLIRNVGAQSNKQREAPGWQPARKGGPQSYNSELNSAACLHECEFPGEGSAWFPPVDTPSRAPSAASWTLTLRAVGQSMGVV